MGIGTGGRRAAASTVVAVAVALGAAGAGASTPSLILTVQLVPRAISPGERALTIVTFRNTSHDPLTRVLVDLRFPDVFGGVKAPADCKPLGASKLDFSCALGDVPGGRTVRSFVTARVMKALQGAQKATVGFSLKVGPGRPKPILNSASASVLASNDVADKGACLASPRTLSATLDEQTTELPAPPVADPSLHLPCTPLSVGVAPKPTTGGYKTNVASVDVPKLSKPALVRLTFANETLPDEKLESDIPAGRTPSLDNPNPLWEFDAKAPGGKRVVPVCRKGPTLPSGWDTCIVRVVAIDTSPTGDLDQGYITLLAQGSGFGDPRYVG